MWDESGWMILMWSVRGGDCEVGGALHGEGGSNCGSLYGVDS